MCPDATRIADTICAYPGCTRTVWKDPDGSFSSFCGRSHRLAMKKLDTETVGFGGGRGASAGSLSFCKNCEIRPVYVENGYDHPFCGKRCASAYDAAKRPTRVESRPRDTPPPEAPPSKICSLKGCKKRAFIDASGVASPFCSQRHRRESVKTGQSEACLLCTENPKIIVGGKLSNFCSRTCSNDAINAAPAILQLNSTDVRYKAVEKQFSEQWKHPTRPGKISKIWRIISTQDAFSNFARYQLSVERARKISSGNSRRRWHGTTRQCRIGDSDNENTLCSHTSCSVCSIIRSSFQLARSGVRHNYGRFGAGIYTTGTSSKANDYIKELGGSSHRAILLNDVVLGKTNKLTVSDPNLMQPPDGFDSVIGEPGGDLNYDEAVVYNDDAIRPLYLVIFKPT